MNNVIKCASSSKQNRKNRCGYQCRQKCHHRVAKGGTYRSAHTPPSAPPTRHSTSTTQTTAPLNAKQTATDAADSPRIARSAHSRRPNSRRPHHSNAPQAAQPPPIALRIASASAPCQLRDSRPLDGNASPSPARPGPCHVAATLRSDALAFFMPFMPGSPSFEFCFPPAASSSEAVLLSTCQCQIAQSHRFATPQGLCPGFTTCARPTAASIGTSRTCSHTHASLQRNPISSAAQRFTTRRFSSPYIASPINRPVHIPPRSSSRVAHTRISVCQPPCFQFALQRRRHHACQRLHHSADQHDPCPCRACHATRSTPSSKKTIVSICFQNLLARATRYRYLLFPCASPQFPAAAIASPPQPSHVIPALESLRSCRSLAEESPLQRRLRHQRSVNIEKRRDALRPCAFFRHAASPRVTLPEFPPARFPARNFHPSTSTGKPAHHAEIRRHPRQRLRARANRRVRVHASAAPAAPPGPRVSASSNPR